MATMVFNDTQNSKIIDTNIIGYQKRNDGPTETPYKITIICANHNVALYYDNETDFNTDVSALDTLLT